VRQATLPTGTRPACREGRRAIAESLEGRRLLAGTPLPTGFTEQIWVQDPDLLNDLTAMDFAPDGRLFVLEKKGNVRIVKGRSVNPTPFLSIPVRADVERGLDGITLDPGFATNGYVYLYYTGQDLVNRLVRVTADPAQPDLALPNSMIVLLEGISAETGLHNGGSLHFGLDGMLYVGTGDAGNSALAADLSSLNGKILRLNVAAFPGSIIPADNPFVATPGARPEIFASGFRNPFTAAVDPASGMLYVNDVGGSTAEEINEVAAGGFYGWPQAEGAAGKPGITDPVHTYAHRGQGELDSAITGGVFYDGDSFPAEYRGRYFFSDYARRFIRVLDPAPKQVTTFLDPQFKNTIDLDVGPDGALYGLGFQWRVTRYAYAPPAADLNVTLDASAVTGTAPLTVDFTARLPDGVDPASLTYLWDFHDNPADPVPGITAGQTFRHTYTAAGTYHPLVTVFGGRTPVPVALDIVVAGKPNKLPKLKIVVPKTYTAGQTVSFSSKVTDKEDGAPDLTGYQWRVDFHHADHTHPFTEMPGVDRGSIVIPRTGELDPDQWYRIHLSVTDSSGQTATKFVDVRPKLGTLMIRTTPPGVSVTLDGAPLVTPARIVGVQGALRVLDASADGLIFSRWSNGAPASQEIHTPKRRLKLIAFYSAPDPVISSIAAAPVAADLLASPLPETPGHQLRRQLSITA